MDWLDEVRTKLKRKNQVLFAKDTEFLQDLAMLFREQSHRTMALWALDLAAESVTELEEKYPDETRPRDALEAASNSASRSISGSCSTGASMLAATRASGRISC